MLHGTTKVQNAHFVVDQNKKLAWGNQTVYLAGSEANGIDFYHSSTHLGRWKTTGLGIGTTDIGYPLDVHGNMMLSGALYGFQDGSGRVYDRKFLEFAPQPCYYTGDNNHFHTFKSYGGTAIMSIGGANNRVGIGETSPDELLHIKSSTASKPVIKLENAGDVTNGAQLHFVMSTTSEGDNDIPGTIRFKGMNSANAETEFSTIYTKNIDITDGTEDSEMHFRTMAAGTLGSTMMIQSDKVGIGTTSPSQIFHVVDSSNGTTPDLLSVRSTGSEVRIGIGVSNPSTALDFSTALPNGGGTIQGVFRMNLINNIRVGSHNGRLVLQSNNGIRIGAYNDNPSGNVYGLEVKHTRASTNTGDNILNVLNSDNTSLMMVKSSGAMGLGTDSPDTKLDIEGNSSNGTIVQIRDTGDDYPTGITYNHGVSGHHYAWYAGTMDGTSGERKFTIGTKVVNGFHNDLTTSAYSLLTLNQDGGSVSVTNDLKVGGNVLINGITDAGGVPKFLVRRTSDTSAISQNAWTTIVFNGEDFDTGSDFNVTNGIFSAPVAGYYHFSWQLRFNNVPSTTDYIWTRLLTTDEDILAGIVRIDTFADATISYWQTGGSATVHLDAGDTVRVDAYNANGGTGITIDGSSSNYQSWFTGHMVI